jgi:predicted GIY-YIG superfamily endonuclease
MKNYSVYKILFPNGKVYFGITNNPKRRIGQHKKEARAGSQLKLYRAIRKHGFSFEFQILHSGLKISEARKIEMELIDENNSMKNGYNSTLGGQSAPILNPEIKEKILKKIRSEDHREKVSSTMKSVMRQDSVKEKISIASKNNWATNRDFIVLAMKKKAKCPEQIRKMKAARKKAWDDESRRKNASETMIKRMSSEQARLTSKSNLNSEESVAKRNATKRSPEWRMAQSLRLKEFNARKKQEAINAEALAYLASTDWLIIREVDAGVPCPAEIKAERASARARIVR